jgi:hypothetical protein
VATDARTCDDKRSHVAVVRDAGSFKKVHSEWLSEEEEGGEVVYRRKSADDFE